MSASRVHVTVRSSLGSSTALSGAVVRRTSAQTSPDSDSTVNLDELLFPGTDFNAAWRDGFQTLLRSVALDNQVNYVVPGDPLLGDITVGYLLDLQREGDVTVSVDVDSSPREILLELATNAIAIAFIDALSLVEIDAAHPFAGGSFPLHTGQQIVITNVDNERLLPAVARVLRRHYQPDIELTLLSLGHSSEQRVIPLSSLDNVALKRAQALIIPQATGDDFQRTSGDLQRLVARLRAPDGCPWDRDQTNQSLTKNLIEESYELLDAIESADSEAMREELGDFILQAYLHCQIAEEAGSFTLEDVLDTLITKLVRRHPHVFATAIADDADTVVQNWDEIKRAERSGRSDKSSPQPLGNVPLSLPALLRTQSLLKRAGRSGLPAGEVAVHRDRALAEMNVDAISMERLTELIASAEQASQAGIDLEQMLRDWSRAFEKSIADAPGIPDDQ